jgi:DNA integrity scanning protein DisA with diadenylate cyclase activity
MTLREAKQVIDEYLAQGETEEDIVGALYVMYQNDDINLEELEKLIGLLGYEFTEEFKNMSDEDKKTKGYTEDKDAEDLPKEKVEEVKEANEEISEEEPEEKSEDEDEEKAKKLFGLN